MTREMLIAFVDGVVIHELADFHDHLLGTAARIVGTGQELVSPMIFTLSKEGKLAIMPPAGSKEAIARYQKAIVQDPMVRACAIVFEAWVSSYTKDDPRARPENRVEPRLDPAHTEGIVVSIMTAGRQALTISPIKRPENTVERAPFRWLDEGDGRHEGRFVR